ncbi:MAG: TonB-dependent receptor plug domain-containing protein [Bacteroidales bacterium]|nr:TonB-dependent receptor plug domain-containing protein [Bacteroidales bacterium]
MEHTINSCGRYPIHQATRISRQQMIACCVMLLFTVLPSPFTLTASAQTQDTIKKLDEVIISASRADNKTPLTTSTIDRKTLEENKIAAALPYMLELEPSVVTSSENGTVGVTNMRIRGVDATRINVNINGIPLNDAESQSVYWYNIPNLGGMSQSVQLQRGIGVSNGGSAAFGGAMNLQTLNTASRPYGTVDLSYGSWNTFQYGVVAGSGLTKHGFSFDAAYNGLNSDGFMRGGKTNQHSLFLSAGHYGERSLLKFIAIIGQQNSGITWDGATLEEIEQYGPTYHGRGHYVDENGEIAYYNNETDNYWQQHFQLYYSYLLSDYWSLSTALDYTFGYGYTESYKDDKNIKNSFGDIYALMNVGDSISDYIYRKMMRNNAYTANLSARYAKDALTLNFGGSYMLYDGVHYGNLIWIEKYNAITAQTPYTDWYSQSGLKHDATAFAKMNYEFSPKLNLYTDLQVRFISYGLHGTDDDYGQLDYDTTHLFFNPKVGVNYRIDDYQRTYFVAGIANREPARSDIKEALADGSHMNHETMLDIELGYQLQKEKLHFEGNLYAMLYKDQLVANGRVTESGYSLMDNVDKSYRLGVELASGYRFCKQFSMEANLTLSLNKIIDYQYEATLNDWYSKTILDLGNTDLALSPSVIGAAIATYSPFENAKLQLIGKYVGEQYADNTGREEVKVPAYFLLNARASYVFKMRHEHELECQLAVNNILNHDYRLSAYIYGTYDPATGTYDNYHYWFQQPGINFMGRIIYRF